MKYIVITVLVIALIFGAIVWRCSHNENTPYYGNEDYYFVTAYVDSGRSSRPYCGVVLRTDYQKWLGGCEGTIFIYSTTHEGYGNRVNISRIVTMSNHGSYPEWLPMNFWWL